MNKEESSVNNLEVVESSNLNRRDRRIEVYNERTKESRAKKSNLIEQMYKERIDRYQSHTKRQEEVHARALTRREK